MIKAYLAWFPSYYEGEDTEIRYSIFKDGKSILKESKLEEYCKPSLSGLMAVGKLLDVLADSMEEEIVIVINDGSVYELLNGSSMTNKRDVQKMAADMRDKIDKFSNLEIENISGDHVAVGKWDEILKP